VQYAWQQPGLHDCIARPALVKQQIVLWSGKANAYRVILCKDPPSCLGRAGPPYRYLGCYSGDIGPSPRKTQTTPFRQSTGLQGVELDNFVAAAQGEGFQFFALQGDGQCVKTDMEFKKASEALDDSCADVPCSRPAGTCPMHIRKVYRLSGVQTQYQGVVYPENLMPAGMTVFSTTLHMGIPFYMHRRLHMWPAELPENPKTLHGYCCLITPRPVDSTSVLLFSFLH
jgi:hypothetical protein